MSIWNKGTTNLPKNGSVLDVIFRENPNNGEPLGLLVGIVENGKIMMKTLDITNHVKMWHKIPNITQKDDGLLYWDEDE